MAAEPDMQEALNNMGEALDKVLRQRLPDQTFVGPLAGMEAEIRQDAMLLLIERFLFSNPQLQAATNSGDSAAIENEIYRSINGALKICRPRLRREITREQSRHQEGLEEGDPRWGTCEHPSHQSFWSLPFEIQKEVVFLLVRNGVAQQQLTAEGAALVIGMLEESLNLSALAAARKISRQVAFYRVKPVRRFLRENLDKTEFPL